MNRAPKWGNQRSVPVLDDIGLKRPSPKRLDVLFNIALCCLLLGAVLGLLSAWLNTLISPHYFQEAMGWSQEEVRPASLIQGGLGGLAYGFAFAGFFAVVCGWATRFQCTFPFALRQVFIVCFFVILGWLAGGAIESAFYQPAGNERFFSSLSSPDWYSRWVHGAILGQKAGFLMGAVSCPFIVWRAWRKWARNEGMRD